MLIVMIITVTLNPIHVHLMTDLSISVTRLGLSLHSHKDFATRGGEIALSNLSSPPPPHLDFRFNMLQHLSYKWAVCFTSLILSPPKQKLLYSTADHTTLVSFSLLQVYNTMLTNLFFKLQYVFKVSMINMSIYSE